MDCSLASSSKPSRIITAAGLPRKRSVAKASSWKKGTIIGNPLIAPSSSQFNRAQSIYCSWCILLLVQFSLARRVLRAGNCTSPLRQRQPPEHLLHGHADRKQPAVAAGGAIEFESDRQL